MLNSQDQELPALARALERRYPGVRVFAREYIAHKGPMRETRFEAPRALLVDLGLIEPHGKWGEVFDEFGGRMYLSLLPKGITQVLRFDWADEGAINVSRPRSNPDNAKTRVIVAKLLKRIANGVAHG